MDAPPWALVSFASIVILSPGPLTMILLAFAALGRGGAAIPLLIGGALAYAAIWGAAAAFSRHIAGVEQALFEVLQWVGFAFILWLAWLIATAPRSPMPERGGAPGLLIGAGAVFCNPKVWVTATMAATLFCDPYLSPKGHAAVFGGTVGLLMVFWCGAYMIAGKIAQRLLMHPMAHRGFSIIASCFMVGSYLVTMRGGR